MGQDHRDKGMIGHVLKLGGKIAYGLGVASDRREDGMCWKCGERPPARGVAGKAGTCKKCGKDVLGLLFEVAEAADDDD